MKPGDGHQRAGHRAAGPVGYRVQGLFQRTLLCDQFMDFLLCSQHRKFNVAHDAALRSDVGLAAGSCFQRNRSYMFRQAYPMA